MSVPVSPLIYSEGLFYTKYLTDRILSQSFYVITVGRGSTRTEVEDHTVGG